ncbi:hypothetical protein FPRO05_07295 [Fusarium proliferatum]|uniref:Major facilitator superfamily (MFS) profile domain-containing protein n=1 Tax=Gibberella intermedia TaxID=948311 RepID=A0A365MKJ8_GIBIN|nr:hypothetical protein FPRO05_07295 [Fusarium proliferatum]
MSDEKPTVGGDEHKEIGSNLNDAPSIAQEKATDAFADINHVARLGMPNAAELEKRIVRKLDMWMLPQLWILYMFNYLNRTNIAQARLNTFNEDLNLGEGDYQTAVAVLTVGYMLAQLPSNMLITRVRPSIFLPVAAFIWSAISALTVLCTSAGGLWGVQFVLGIVEAPLFPGAVFLMSCWYTRREFALRVALLYSGLVLAQAFSGLIAAGVFAGLDGPMGLAGWKWLFIIEGAASGFFAITAFFVLPNYPDSPTGGATRYMTEDMRKLAAARILDDRVEFSEKSTVMHGLKLAVTDLKLYMFLFMNIFITSSYGFNNFFPTIVRGLAGCFSANTLQYTWAVSTLGQTPEKRAAGGAIVNIFGHLGNVISPYFFPDRDQPRYTMAMILQIVFASLGITLASIIKWHLTKKNKKLKAEADRLGVDFNPFTT